MEEDREAGLSAGGWPSNARVELRNGRIIDVAAGQALGPGVSIALEGGRIMALPGLAGEPADVRPDFVVDLQGRTVIPGLFNSHCHLQLMGFVMLKGEARERQHARILADCVKRGVTNIRDAFAYDLRPNRLLSERIARGELLGPRIHQAVMVAPLGGTYVPRRTLFTRTSFSFLGMPLTDYRLPDSGAVVLRPGAGEQEARAAVDRAVDERGAEYIKFCHQHQMNLTFRPGAAVLGAAQLSAAADQARRRGVKSILHHVTVEGFRLGVQAGVTSLAHIPGGAHLEEADVRAFLDAGCILEPTLTVAYYYAHRLPGDPYRDHPRLARVAALRRGTHVGLAEEYWIPEAQKGLIGAMEGIERGETKLFGLVDMSFIYRFFSPLVADGVDNLRTLYSEGAPLACGSDACVSPVSPAAVPLEMEMLDLCLNGEPGLAPFGGADALRTATIHSARAMGLEEKLGSIAPGKIADLVVVDGDPLADYRLIGKPAAAVFMDGRLAVNACGLRAEVARYQA